jgi:4-hydroxyproline epimerase
MVVVENVLSYRVRTGVEVRTERHGTVHGEIAYGGNWFFLVSGRVPALVPENVEALTDFAWDVRRSLTRAGITGTSGEEIDHVELFGPPVRSDADAKNFVLCPGKQYDRSPCGTGLSAKLACLAAAGQLAEGEVWRQESIIGGLFAGSVRLVEGGVVPTLWGRAFVTAEATLLVEPGDPFPEGIGS